jgi:hypothetical protein
MLSSDRQATLLAPTWVPPSSAGATSANPLPPSIDSLDHHDEPAKGSPRERGVQNLLSAALR